MSPAPLHEYQLGNNESYDENEYHLGMHRLVAAMLLMHTRMLHSTASPHTGTAAVPGRTISLLLYIVSQSK